MKSNYRTDRSVPRGPGSGTPWRDTGSNRSAWVECPQRDELFVWHSRGNLLIMATLWAINHRKRQTKKRRRNRLRSTATRKNGTRPLPQSRLGRGSDVIHFAERSLTIWM